MRDIPLAAVLTLLSLVACPGTTHAASVPPAEIPAEPAQPDRPGSALDLLKNLKAAWDRKLLIQPEFWSNETLRQFLNADGVEWNAPNTNGPPEFPPEIGLVLYRGFGSAHSSLLPGAVSIIRWYQRDSPGPVTPGNPHPGHEESGGSLHLSFGPGITWSVVRELFGPDYVNRGPPPPPNLEYWPGRPVSTSRSQKVVTGKPKPTIAEPQAETASEDLSVCYLAPQGMPYSPVIPMAHWQGDQICFGLQSGTSSPSQNDRVHDPEGDDKLIYVHLAQQVGHIPIQCHQRPVDPSWKPWCPPD